MCVGKGSREKVIQRNIYCFRAVITLKIVEVDISKAVEPKICKENVDRLFYYKEQILRIRLN